MKTRSLHNLYFRIVITSVNRRQPWRSLLSCFHCFRLLRPLRQRFWAPNFQTGESSSCIFIFWASWTYYCASRVRLEFHSTGTDTKHACTMLYIGLMGIRLVLPLLCFKFFSYSWYLFQSIEHSVIDMLGNEIHPRFGQAWRIDMERRKSIHWMVRLPIEWKGTQRGKRWCQAIEGRRIFFWRSIHFDSSACYQDSMDYSWRNAFDVHPHR